MYYDDDEYSRIAELHKLPLFLPTDHLKTRVFPAIALVVMILTILFNVYYVLVDRHDPTHTTAAKQKASYQLTNFSVNLVLGLMGLYHFLFTLEKESVVSLEQQVVGQDYLYPLAALQIGFQIWALPVGFLVKESPSMLAHHVAVILVSSMAGFLTMGFRYWAPFFFGMIELSSLPLAIMNTFKDKPHWIEKYPGVYSLVRIVFAASFLTLRWVMYYPRKFLFLRHCMWAVMSSDSRFYRGFVAYVWVASFFIASLQLYWGYLILKSVLFPKKKRSKKVSLNGEGQAQMLNGKLA